MFEKQTYIFKLYPNKSFGDYLLSSVVMHQGTEGAKKYAKALAEEFDNVELVQMIEPSGKIWTYLDSKWSDVQVSSSGSEIHDSK